MRVIIIFNGHTDWFTLRLGPRRQVVALGVIHSVLLRGFRPAGLIITIAATAVKVLQETAPWAIGWWTESLPDAIREAQDTGKAVTDNYQDGVLVGLRVNATVGSYSLRVSRTPVPAKPAAHTVPDQPDPPAVQPAIHVPVSDRPGTTPSAELKAILDRLSYSQSDARYRTGNIRGFIQNVDGDKCTYEQVPTRDDSVSHFYRSLTGADTVLRFDDPRCMAGEGVFQDINITQINNILANFYRGDSGTYYNTRADELHRTSRMQIRGYCVQSSTRSNRAFLVDYFTVEDSIAIVVHNIALQGCG